jgi:hypothetical protein
MKSISVKQNNKCIIGTFESLLIDCECSDVIKNKLLQELNERTIGTITSLFPNEIEEFTKEIFENVIVIEIKRVEEFDTIELVDNDKTFGLLFWNGTDSINNKQEVEINNKHLTRFICKNNTEIILMDPQSGSILTFKISELYNLSKNGFSFVKMSKK